MVVHLVNDAIQTVQGPTSTPNIALVMVRRWTAQAEMQTCTPKKPRPIYTRIICPPIRLSSQSLRAQPRHMRTSVIQQVTGNPQCVRREYQTWTV